MASDARARLLITAEDLTRAAWNSAANSAQAGSKKISGLVKGAFAGLSVAAAAAGLKKLVSQSLEYGDAIGKAAVKSGLSTEAISQLGFAAAGSNIDLSELSKAIGTMQVNISKAASGSKTLSDSFDELGVDFAKFKALRADKQFEVLAEAINRLPDETDKARLASELFGKAGGQLLPLFSEGAEGIRKARIEAERLGLSMSKEQQEKLQAAGDAMGKLGKAASGLATELTLALAPGITLISDRLTEFLARLKETPAKVNKLVEEIGNLESRIQAAEKAKGKGLFQTFIEGSGSAAQEDIGALKSRLAAKRAILEEQRKKLRDSITDSKDQSTDGVLKDRIEIELPVLPKLNLVAENDEFRKELDEVIAQREGAMERRRILGGRRGEALNDEQQQEILKGQQEYFEQLSANVAQAAEDQADLSGEILDDYFAGLQEKTNTQNEFLIGAMEEFGRSVQSSLSDVFFNAGKGADQFADSVLNAFKRIIADAAANKLVGLIGGLFGGNKTPSVSGGASAGGGLLGSVIGGLFGGFKADGGPVSSGMGYVVGERGPELFMPRQSGTIIPNGAAMGGAVTINMPVNIDARGATTDAVKMLEARLPRMLKETSDNAVARVKDQMSRGALLPKR